ncbi:MAG: hypothetical protein V2B19_06515 [Pseudomonadota bacterium]
MQNKKLGYPPAPTAAFYKKHVTLTVGPFFFKIRSDIPRKLNTSYKISQAFSTKLIDMPVTVWISGDNAMECKRLKTGLNAVS